MVNVVNYHYSEEAIIILIFLIDIRLSKYPYTLLITFMYIQYTSLKKAFCTSDSNYKIKLWLIPINEF